MKGVRYFLFAILINGIFVGNSYSQGDEIDSDEQYCRENMAFMNPMYLGINESNYARCVRAQNYLEPEKRPGRVVINGVDFLDDGRNNDLVAHDGILTSNHVYGYSKGSAILQPGQYRPVTNDFILYDVIFNHQSRITTDKIKITCKWVWVKCNSWPQELQQLCYRICWPFNGSFELKECEIEWDIK